MTAQGRKFIAVSSVMPEDYRGTIHHVRKWVEMCRRHMPHLDVRYVTHAIFAEIAGAGARIVMDGHGGDYTVGRRALNISTSTSIRSRHRA